MMTKTIESYIHDQFPGVQCKVTRTKYQGIIHAFFFQCESIQKIEEQWQPLYSAVAFNYQSKIESEFERWNFYLFYLYHKDVDRALKYKIENDPISSRKIVIEHFKGKLTPKKLDTILDEHITNKSTPFELPAADVTKQKKEFKKDEVLLNAISSVPHLSKKKKADDETVQILKTLETHFANEV